MKRTSLERKILCSRENRVADAEVAKVILERAAGRALREYFEKDHRSGNYVVGELWPEKFQEWLRHERDSEFTYGGMCRKFVEKYQGGEEMDDGYLLMRLMTGKYTGGGKLYSAQSAEKNKSAQPAEHETQVFKRESLENRLMRVKKAEEEKTQGAGGIVPPQRKLSEYYAWMEKEPETSVRGDVFAVNHINMREFFQALSLITGKREDAVLPETLAFGENLNIEEVLEAGGGVDERYWERLYMLLIEPFAKIAMKSGNGKCNL